MMIVTTGIRFNDFHGKILKEENTMYIIMFVLNDGKKLDMLLDGWNKIGVRGATILQSTGAYRIRKRIPGRFAFTTANSDEASQTLLAMVENEETVHNCLAETQRLIGDLREPNTGIFTYWPVTDIIGIHKNYKAD